MYPKKIAPEGKKKLFFSENGTNKTTKSWKAFPFLNALKPVLLSLMIIGIQPKINPERVFINQRRSFLRWWNILTLVYLHAFGVKAIATIFLTKGGISFWLQLTIFVKCSAATISADIYVYKQQKLRLLLKKFSNVYASFKEEERQKFRKRIKIGTLVGWLLLTVYFATSIKAVYDIGIEKFLQVHLFSLRIPWIPPIVYIIVTTIFMLFRQIIMWGTLCFMVIMYITLCSAGRLSFR